MKQAEKDILTLMLCLTFFKESKIKPDKYIDGFDSKLLIDKIEDHKYLSNSDQFDKDLKTMLTQSYKKIINNKNNTRQKQK